MQFWLSFTLRTLPVHQAADKRQKSMPLRVLLVTGLAVCWHGAGVSASKFHCSGRSVLARDCVTAQALNAVLQTDFVCGSRCGFLPNIKRHDGPGHLYPFRGKVTVGERVNFWKRFNADLGTSMQDGGTCPYSGGNGERVQSTNCEADVAILNVLMKPTTKVTTCSIVHLELFHAGLAR